MSKKSDWLKTPEGKKQNSKRFAKRYRQLGWIELLPNIYPEEIEINYHHVNNLFVVPIPRNVHFNKFGNNHREKCNNWIESIYCINLKDVIYE